MRHERLSAVAAVVALLAALSLASLPAAQARPKTSESFVAVTGGARDYWLYTPAGKVPKQGRPLVVYLHGCTQNNGSDIEHAFGSRWNELAARENAMVLYPLQAPYDMADPTAVEGNGMSCWNWFLDKNMHRGAGEPAILADLTTEVAAAHGVDRDRIFVMGTSAGADMAAILAATYPDVFRAAAMLAGCAYAACSDVSGALAHAELSSHGLSPIPAIVFQGSADTLNNVAMGETLRSQQIGTHDWADDGLANASVRLVSAEVHGDPTSVSPDPEGNVCVGDHSNWPCASGVTGWESYPYTAERYASAGGRVVVEWWLIHGLGHNYPGGDYESTFTDPAGPDITTAAWRFFSSAAEAPPAS